MKCLKVLFENLLRCQCASSTFFMVFSSIAESWHRNAWSPPVLLKGSHPGAQVSKKPAWFAGYNGKSDVDMCKTCRNLHAFKECFRYVHKRGSPPMSQIVFHVRSSLHCVSICFVLVSEKKTHRDSQLGFLCDNNHIGSSKVVLRFDWLRLRKASRLLRIVLKKQFETNYPVRLLGNY